MSEEEHREQNGPETGGSAPGAETEAPRGDGGGEQAHHELTQDAAELHRLLEEEREEVARARDQAMRAAAELENVRRRTQREVESAHKFALEGFASELLPVVDSLEKSVDAVHAHQSDEDTFTAVREGIELSLRLFLDTLGKAGIEQVDPRGARFDPDYHEAMTMVESAEAAPNTVVDVMQKGYTLNGRVLRPALVVVAKAASGGEDG